MFQERARLFLWLLAKTPNQTHTKTVSQVNRHLLHASAQKILLNVLFELNWEIGNSKSGGDRTSTDGTPTACQLIRIVTLILTSPLM